MRDFACLFLLLVLPAALQGVTIQLDGAVAIDDSRRPYNAERVGPVQDLLGPSGDVRFTFTFYPDPASGARRGYVTGDLEFLASGVTVPFRALGMKIAPFAGGLYDSPSEDGAPLHVRFFAKNAFEAVDPGHPLPGGFRFLDGAFDLGFLPFGQNGEPGDTIPPDWPELYSVRYLWMNVSHPDGIYYQIRNLCERPDCVPLSVTRVPESSTLPLILLGLSNILLASRRRP